MMEGWKKIEFGKIADFKNGINFSKIQKGDKGIPTIDVKNMFGNNCYVNLGKLYSVDKKINKDYFLQNGDILFVRSSLKEEGVGWTSLYKGTSFSHTFCGFIIRARIKDIYSNIIIPEFLTYYFRNDISRKELVSLSGRVAITNVNQGLLKSFVIHIPPLPEQRKIAYVLSTVQKAIEQQDKLIRTVTELKKALMQKLFTEGLYGEKQKQTEIGLVPESWEVVRIGDVFDIQQGKQVSKKNRIGNNQKSFLRTANVFWGKIDITSLDVMNFSKEEEKKFELQHNDILVCEGGDIGRTAICEINMKGIFYQNHIHRLRIKQSDFMPKFFVYWMFYFMSVSTYIKDAGNVTTIPNLSKSRLANLLMPKPEITIQEQIIETLKTLDNKIEFHRKKKQTLSDLFKTLLHELMTGQRRVNKIDFGLRLRSAHEPKQAQPEKEDNQKK